ncbi:MAG: glycosyltransferase, partial [Muribaculaceae bacterium]|nr:glycosyltransferase [Muribaculaceae bacterium]
THIVPEGEGVKNDLQHYKVTKKTLKVLGHGNIKGIDVKRFDPELPELAAKAEKIRRKDIFTYIFIGRLVGDKGINELIKAFDQLNAQYPKTRLLLVGGFENNLDPLDPETLRLMKKNKAIESVGIQRDVRPWLLASDALVFPSYREGFPNVVIEAGAMGLPSIVTDINGSREIINDGVNGIIIPPRQSETLRQAMEIFVTDSSLLERMASVARESVISRFEQGFVRQCLKDYYREIMK